LEPNPSSIEQHRPAYLQAAQTDQSILAGRESDPAAHLLGTIMLPLLGLLCGVT
jgi:hypothetical protein